MGTRARAAGIPVGGGQPMGFTAPTILTAPANFAARWNPPMTLARGVDGTYSTGFDSTSLLPASPTRTLYVNPQTGNDSTGTGAIGAPFANLFAALKTTSGGAATDTTLIYIDSTADVIMRGIGAGIGGTVNSNRGWSNTTVVGSVFVVNRSGRRIISAAVASLTLPTFTANGTAGVYDTTISTTDGAGVIDTTVTEVPLHPRTGAQLTYVKPAFKTYIKVGSIAALVPGSWYHDGTVLHVKPIDGRDLTVAGNASSLIVSNNANNGRLGMNANRTVYVDGIDFVGGQRPFFAETLSATDTGTFVHRNCTFQGSGLSTASNGLSVLGPLTVNGYRSAAYYNALDGFNYHGTDAVTATASPKVFEDSCVGMGNGTTGSTDISSNASTIHDYGAIIRLNPAYPNSDDKVMADASNNPVVWVLGGVVGQAVTTIYANSASTFLDDNAQGWYDGLDIVNGSKPGAWVANNATLMVRNMPVPGNGAPAGGATPGTIGTY